MKIWEMIELITKDNSLEFTFTSYGSRDSYDVNVFMSERLDSATGMITAMGEDGKKTPLPLNEYMRKVDYKMVEKVNYTQAVRYMWQNDRTAIFNGKKYGVQRTSYSNGALYCKDKGNDIQHNYNDLFCVEMLDGKVWELVSGNGDRFDRM